MTAKSLTGKFIRTMIVEPAVYCRSKDDHRARSRYYQMADEAWGQFTGIHAGSTFSDHFGAGFKDGYSEYLYAGGNGSPPPVPPRRYWRDDWQTPEGHESIEHWYEGYRTGAAIAMSLGRRDVAVVPASTSNVCRALPPPGVVHPEIIPSGSPSDVPVVEPEMRAPLPNEILRPTPDRTSSLFDVLNSVVGRDKDTPST
ncbi:MAG: hypothetical protein GXY83_12680 [Rhodopirellula sp.]|nr:hypothetical protein [Rhodopirellula sp.]